jgi:glucose-1-phosphate adenylyltransferase
MCLHAGLSAEEAKASPFIASMGIYVFKKDLMLQLLREQAKSNDFGGEIIPSAAGDKRVMAYLFNDYWEDIGTIKSFFEANLGLAAQVGFPAAAHSFFPVSGCDHHSGSSPPQQLPPPEALLISGWAQKSSPYVEGAACLQWMCRCREHAAWTRSTLCCVGGCIVFGSTQSWL